MPPEGTTPPSPSASDPNFLARAVEATTRILLVLALLAWCFSILRPFVVPSVRRQQHLVVAGHNQRRKKRSLEV